MFIFQADENFTWLAPYAYAIVLLGFGFVLFRVFELVYASVRNRPLYRDILIHRKLTPEQLEVIREMVPFYDRLGSREKKRYAHRVATFMATKQFVGRDDLQVTERMKLQVAGLGCMLSFGRKNYSYHLIEHILLYPGEFYSNINRSHHTGEFNPREKALVLSWPHFKKALLQMGSGDRNLGIHEFMHAMQLEAHRGKDIDSSRFAREFGEILKVLQDEEVRTRLESVPYFKNHGFSNQYEFMALLAQYFFERPKELKDGFPAIYEHTRNLFNMRYGGY